MIFQLIVRCKTQYFLNFTKRFPILKLTEWSPKDDREEWYLYSLCNPHNLPQMLYGIAYCISVKQIVKQLLAQMFACIHFIENTFWHQLSLSISLFTLNIGKKQVNSEVFISKIWIIVQNVVHWTGQSFQAL